MNVVTLVGRIGKDAEVRKLNEKVLISFSLATSRKYKDKQGERQEKTEWHSITYFTKSDAIAQYLTKGSQVSVQGSIGYSQKDEKYYTNIIARELNLLGGGRSQETDPKAKDNDDLPF